MSKKRHYPNVQEAVFGHRLSYVACCTCKWSSYSNASTAAAAEAQWQEHHDSVNGNSHALLTVKIGTSAGPVSMLDRTRRAMKLPR